MRKALEEGQEPDKPLSTYVWEYRPEYQFSRYDLEMQAINQVQNLGETDEDIKNLIDLEQPMVSGADILEAFYSLITDTVRLTPIDGEQEFTQTK